MMPKWIVILTLWLAGAGYSLAGPDHSAHRGCTDIDIRCAKTVTATVTKKGRIWFAWVVRQHLYINYSDNVGNTFSRPLKVNAEPEVIAARGENRPKITLDKTGNIYLSWVQMLPTKWTANIRFAYSLDQGKTFSTPIKVNDDKRVTSHSFNEMVVSNDGELTISWLDGRHALIAKERDETYAGSAIYFASARPATGDTKLINQRMVDGSCVCCRLAMDQDQQGKPILLWRHIFGDNYRDHALLTINDKGDGKKLRRISFENWQIDGCPHHGPTLLRQGKRLHMAWFNDAPRTSGLFYAYSDNQGKIMSAAKHLVDRTNSPAHPHLAQSADGQIQLVWQEFDGRLKRVKLIRSKNGELWTAAETVARYKGSTDYPFLLSHPDGNLLLWHKPGQPLKLKRLM